MCLLFVVEIKKLQMHYLVIFNFVCVGHYVVCMAVNGEKQRNIAIPSV